MLCNGLASAIQQCKSAISIHMFPPSHPPPHPTPLGWHRALDWAPCVIHQLPTSYLFYIWFTYICFNATLSMLSISLSSPLLRQVWVCNAKQTGRRMSGQWAPLLGGLKASQEDVTRGWLVGPLNSYSFHYLKNPGSSEVQTNLRI